MLLSFGILSSATNSSDIQLKPKDKYMLPRFGISYDFPHSKHLPLGDLFGNMGFLFRLSNKTYNRLNLKFNHSQRLTTESAGGKKQLYAINGHIYNSIIRFINLNRWDFIKLYYGMGFKFYYSYKYNDKQRDDGVVFYQQITTNQRYTISLIIGTHFNLYKNLYLAIEDNFGACYSYSHIDDYILSSSSKAYSVSSSDVKLKLIVYF